jgi:hypothetical protein
LADQPLFKFTERQQSTREKIQSFGMGLIDKDIRLEVRQHLQPTEAK